jgi:hypothetical protein
MIFTFYEQNAGRIYHNEIGNKHFKQVRTFGNSLNKSEVQARKN